MRYALWVAALLCLIAVETPGSGLDSYEVWAIDQSNSPGRAFGGTLYIYDGMRSSADERVRRPCQNASTSAAPPLRSASRRRAPIQSGRT